MQVSKEDVHHKDRSGNHSACAETRRRMARLAPYRIRRDRPLRLGLPRQHACACAGEVDRGWKIGFLYFAVPMAVSRRWRPPWRRRCPFPRCPWRSSALRGHPAWSSSPVGFIGNGAIARLGAGVHLLGVEAFPAGTHQAIQGVMHMGVHAIDVGGLGGQSGMGRALLISEPQIGGKSGRGNQKRRAGKRDKSDKFHGASLQKELGAQVAPCAQSSRFFRRLFSGPTPDWRAASWASGPVVGVAFMSLSGLITEPLKVRPA